MFILYSVTVWSLLNIRFQRQKMASPSFLKLEKNFYAIEMTRPWISKLKQLLINILNTSVYFFFIYCLVLGEYLVSNANKWLLLLVPTWENFLCYRNDQTVNFKTQTATNNHFKYFCLIYIQLLFGPWSIFDFKGK